MKYKNIFITVILLYIVICAGPLFAQEFQSISISPAPRSSQQSSAIEKKEPPLQLSEQERQGLKTPLLPVEEPSEFEEYIAGNVSLTVSTSLKQFGYDLFMRPPSTFAPVRNVPVGPGYVIGPGDEVKVSIWGKVEGQWDVVVDRDGNVSIPKVGTLGVSGLKFSELRTLLHKQFSRYYTGFQMNVSMGSLRSIRVYVVGNARRPGAYTLSSLSTLINALFEAGGPSKTGTMRAIEVKRNGKTIVRFDMYDFLLKGDKTRDIRLMPEDVIFIQPVGPLVAIAGSVNNPAIYELKGKTTIMQLIDMAGGLNDVAFKGRVQIERIIDNSRQTVFESDLQDIRDKDIAVQAGDLVKIFQVVKDERIVRLAGAVQREGDYGFSPVMTVRDLISMAGGLKYYAYDREAELTRIHITSEGPITEKIIINLQKALAGEPASNIALQENDYLFVRAIPEWRLYQTVEIQGEVRFPGTYTIKKGERLSSLIERAGGFTDKAFLKGAVFTRKRVEALQQKQIEEMIDRLERELLSTGTARVATASNSREARLMQLETEQKRQFVAKLRTIKAKGRVAIQLESPDKLRGTLYDIELEEKDSIYIPTDPQTVQVIGSVYNQTAFVYERGRNSKYYISLAGGYTENADKGNVYILKANGSAMKASRGFSGLSWNSEYSRWDVGAGQVESGDTIVVPEKLQRIAWMRNIKDITQILYQIAVTSGVLIATF
ncbi:polysaccharide export protein [hydrothermal vent metagenome]|uniref:Polysaccharide export protein n=1 Tax=hydrothermal vent metagenome TaxID=652676 RepID=A0A3B1DF92_9ZZZZ